MRKALLGLGLAALLFAVGLPTGYATTIDFEAQGAGRGGTFTGNCDSPLTIDNATFTGGELLNGETFLPADETAVYGTALVGACYTNPLTITFSSPVSGFSIFVANGNTIDETYTVADNLGGSETLVLIPNSSSGAATFSLADAGITSITITSAATGGFFDFSIDNVTFSSTPEPVSLLLFGTGLGVLGLVRRRRKS